MNPLPSPEIWHRDDFPVLCNWRKLWCNCVEVGVDRGEWSRTFLSRWYGFSWFGVDTWEPTKDMPWDRRCDMLTAAVRIEPYARVARLVQLSSAEAALMVSTIHGKLDFVYIDASHDETSVAADLLAWFPHVSENGIIAGHDFDGDHSGVMNAVTRFCEARNLQVYLTTDDGPQVSWYVYKNGMPGAEWIRNERSLT